MNQMTCNNSILLSVRCLGHPGQASVENMAILLDLTISSSVTAFSLFFCNVNPLYLWLVLLLAHSGSTGDLQ